jgi:hypothetical protein
MKQCGEHDPERRMSQARVDGASTGISPGRNARSRHFILDLSVEVRRPAAARHSPNDQQIIGTGCLWAVDESFVTFAVLKPVVNTLSMALD